MKNSFLWLFLCCFSIQLTAQSGQLIAFGETKQLHSKILNEEREIWVYVPQKGLQNPSLKFPVMYLLDGRASFHWATGVVSHLSEGNNNAIIPDMIVVGIANTHRNRDLTPSYDSLSSIQSNGGGKDFLQFVEQELIPFVEQNYSTAPYRMLVGHSLGGLTVINAMLNNSNLFNAYIALDPSLWWNKMKLINQAEEKLKSEELKGKSFYMAMANSFPASMKKEEAQKDTTNSTVGFRSVVRFDQMLGSGKSYLRSKSQYYPDDSHGSVTLPGLYDGLRFVFDFYKRPSFVKMTTESAQKLEEHYKKVSKNMGYTIFPPENMLVGLAWRCRALDKNFEWAMSFLKLAEKYYPNSIDVNSEFGQWHLDQGNRKKAEEYSLKIQELRDKK